MIADVTDAILKTLMHLIPPLIAPGQIGIVSPADKDEGCLLGVFPYSLTKDTRNQMNNGLRVDGGIQSPPVCLEMYFMITSYAGKKSGLPDDYKLLERAAQAFGDVRELSYQSPLQPSLLPVPRIELLSPDIDTQSKIWQIAGAEHRLSLYYKCAPIAMPVMRFTPTPRVSGVRYDTKVGEW